MIHSAMRSAYRDLCRGMSLRSAVRTHGNKIVRYVLRDWGTELLSDLGGLHQSVRAVIV